MKHGEKTTKAFSANCKISPDDQRTVVACISSTTVDREGDAVVAQGLNSKSFEQNPVVMLLHDYFTLPVGKVTAIKRTDDQIIAKIQFAERPADHPEDEEWVPSTIFSLYQQEIMKGFSVGFTIDDYRMANATDVRKYGEDCKRVINRWSLLELSAVPIPCQPEAVALAVSKGYVSQATADKLFKVEEVAALTQAEQDAAVKAGKVEEAVDTKYTVLKAEDSTAVVLDGDESGITATNLADSTITLLGKIADALEGTPIDAAPVVKEITREIAPAKRVAAVVEVNAPAAAPPVVKHIHRFIEPVQPDVAVKTHKVVVRTLAKLRGRVWVDED